MAARYMSKAQPNEVLTDEGTYNFAKDDYPNIQWDELPRIKVKGKDEKIPCFRAVQARPARLLGSWDTF